MERVSALFETVHFKTFLGNSFKDRLVSGFYCGRFRSPRAFSFVASILLPLRFATIPLNMHVVANRFPSSGNCTCSVTLRLLVCGLLRCLGVGQCKLRRALNLDSEHTVMMMLAVGHPDDDNNLCVSPRRPLNEVITKL